jgi:hypothetical protein
MKGHFLMKFNHCRFAAFALMLACIGLSGCAEQPAPTYEQLLPDDSYTSEFSDVENKWSVQWNGSVKMDLDADGTVNIYGVASGNSKPDIKVSGKGRFTVHDAQNLKAENGARVDAHNCGLVKAGRGTTVRAYACDTVRALSTVSLESHGRTQVQTIEDPAPPRAEQPEIPAPK